MHGLVFSIFLGIGLALLPSLLRRVIKHGLAQVLALYPLAVFLQLCCAIPAISSGKVWQLSFSWVPSLGMTLTFTLDGLGLVMALLISLIGALVIIYGGAYLHANPFLERFYSLTLLFMVAMLGVVLSGNALLLFLFWELTSITSFLLIGFEHQRATARSAAWQALLVTGSGGLAMLAGFALMAKISGSFEIGRWIEASGAIVAHPLSPAAFLLIFAGAAAKSAQFPFHFWLPNAMEAPTPVSAYLHSATMVKAGVYLLARLYPVLSGLALWPVMLTSVGLITLAGGALLALAQTDLKRLLAYTTVASLGGLTLLLGFASPLAVKAAMVFLVAHALYKGALFLVAGGVDHAAHTRDLNDLGGLARAMPYTAAAAGLAMLSMAGIPPLLGFISKELLYEATLAAAAPWLVTGLAVIANVANVAVAGWVGVLPFWGKSGRPLHPHEGVPGLWLPPLLLAVLGLAWGLALPWLGSWFIAPAAQAVLQETHKVKLSLWHGFTPMLGLSALTLLLGTCLAVLRRRTQPTLAAIWHGLAHIGPAALYPRSLHAVLDFAAWQTRVLQSGYLRVYVMVIVLFTVSLAAVTFTLRGGSVSAPSWNAPRFYDVVLIAIIITAASLATRSRSRLATVALLGSIGFSIAIIFLLYSAPDLAMVQFAIETLTVILFVLVLYRLPKFSQLSGRLARMVDVGVALSGGALMSLLMLIVSTHNSGVRLARFYAKNSLPQANGRNIVNVILVDFRGFDTLGEITVLAIAALGVYSLVKLAVRRGSKRRSPAQGGER